MSSGITSAPLFHLRVQSLRSRGAASTIGVNFSQQLLQGVGRDVTRRNILIAKNNRKIADLAFAQQAITTVTSTITAYWELVYARECQRRGASSQGLAKAVQRQQETVGDWHHGPAGRDSRGI